MPTRSALSLLLAVAAVALGALLGPLPAQAAPANCVAPPGTSGIDQYCETVPAAGGDQGTRGGGGGGTGGHHTLGSSLSRKTVAQLHRSAAGRAVLGLSTGSTLASTTSGSGSAGGSGKSGSRKHGGSSHGSGSAASQSGTPAGRSDNPLQAIRSAVSTGASVGPGLIWIFIALALVMCGAAWVSYRRSLS